MKKKVIVSICTVILFSIAGVMALAANPVKLIVNGQEIKTDVPPQIINNRVMVPIRWVAESLGADVEWNKNTVNITRSSSPTEESVSKEQVAQWIEKQGRYEADSYYYMDGLSFESVNIDRDDALEIMAKIDGAVHLGNFFVFDRDSSGKYQLIVEQDWKVESWDVVDPIDLEGKKVFQLVTRTGGTGLDNFTIHFWYLEQGKFVEAWQGIMFERSMSFTPESYYKRVGGYQIDAENKQLYAWETRYQLAEDGVTPVGEVKTDTMIYQFNGTSFVK